MAAAVRHGQRRTARMHLVAIVTALAQPVLMLGGTIGVLVAWT